MKSYWLTAQFMSPWYVTSKPVKGDPFLIFAYKSLFKGSFTFQNYCCYCFKYGLHSYANPIHCIRLSKLLFHNFGEFITGSQTPRFGNSPLSAQPIHPLLFKLSCLCLNTQPTCKKEKEKNELPYLLYAAPEINISPVPDIVSSSPHFVPVTRSSGHSQFVPVTICYNDFSVIQKKKSVIQIWTKSSQQCSV